MRLVQGFFGLSLLGLLSAHGCKCNKEENNMSTTQQKSESAPTPMAGTTAATPGSDASGESKLGIEVLSPGDGAEAQEKMKVTVHYTGKLVDGTKFDSSLDRNEPFSFVLGAGNVIAGWDQGVKGMKVKEKRRLTIPPQLGYGERGVPGVIPPQSTLIFEVELIKVEP